MQERRQLSYLKGRIAMPEAQPQPQPPIQNFSQPPPPQPQPEQPRPISAKPDNKGPESRKNAQRIDTEQIPRPIIRAEESAQYLQFSTQPVPLYHPPQSHNFFVTKDEGNVGPRLMRTSIYAIGNESSILNQTEIPFGVVVQPLQEPFPGEEDVPVVQFNHDPIRCNRCKAYVNPFFQFVDSGNSFICNICKAKNPVPMEYYSPLSQGNQRANKYMSPELHKGAYEIVAPNDYIKKKIENILILFCIEITQRTVSKGIYKQIITSIQSTLDSIPQPDRTDIAFITFDSRIQFYNIPQNLNSEPQIIVVSELNEANVPLPLDKLFLNVQNDKEKIDYMLEKLEKYGVSNKPHSVAVGTVLTNAYNLIAPRTGRILYFGSQAPTSGIGKVTVRRLDQKLFGSDEEKNLYKPQNQEFVKLGELCQRSHISTDLFIFSEDHFDLATVAPISNLTGGQIYFYPQFHPVVNGTELHYQIYRNLTRAYAYDGVMTLRTSEGLVLQSYITSSGIREVRDLELACIHADQSIGILLKQDEKIVASESYLQYALLYTNQAGQRLIRVFNQQLQVVNKNNANNPWHNIFKTADMDAILLLLIRKFLPNILTHSLKQVRQQIFDALVSMLHSYRKYCSSNSPTGQLILSINPYLCIPDAIKTLPLFIQALNKRDILKYGIVRVDNRIYEQHLLLYQTFSYVNNMLYPKLYQIHDCQQILIDEKYYVGQVGKENDIIIPNNLAISQDKIKSNGIYILDCSEYIFVYVCNDVSPPVIREIFGVQNMNDVVNIDEMPQLDTDLNQIVNNIIDALRRYSGGAYQPVKIIKQNSTSSAQFTCKLFEDDWQTEKSYGEYLCEIHSAILAKGI